MQKKCVLVNFLWTIFNDSIRFGQRAIQYTDLLGFFTIKSNMPPATLKGYGDLVAKTLNSQLTQLSTHSNSLLYSRLAEQLSFGGFYLEFNYVFHATPKTKSSPYRRLLD